MSQPEIIGKTEVHEAAALFPLLKDKEFAALVKDIKENGIQQPLIYRNGVLIDGRNRLRAAVKLGLPETDIPKKSLPAVTTDADVYEWVYSANVLRRHLTEQQRAALAISLMEKSGELAKLEEEARVLKAANRSQHGKDMTEARKTGKKLPKKEGKQRGLVVKTVAKRAKVSESTADAVIRTRKTSPEKFAGLVSGKKADGRGRGKRTMWRVPQDPMALAAFLAGKYSQEEIDTLVRALSKVKVAA